MRRPSEKAFTIGEILASRGLSLYHVSRRSAELFGRPSRFYIPHNLYSELARRSAVPTIHQILALSHITDYRWPDWLAAFGIDLDKACGAAVSLPRQRTVLLDSSIHDPNAWIPWFAARPQHEALSAVTPLGSLLRPTRAKRAGNLLRLNGKEFLYARVGTLDAYALPFFVPGSIIRVDPRGSREPCGPDGNPAVPFYLVEHDRGLSCSRLRFLGNGRFLLQCPQLPCAERELQSGRDGRVVGVVDAEIRPMNPHREGYPWLEGADQLISQPVQVLGEHRSLKDLLQSSRLRAGLSFRQASSFSRLLARRFSDDLYFAAPSTLSDYEVLATPPRHIQKIVTLCLLYAIRLEHFLLACGLPLQRAGRHPIPDAILGREPLLRNHDLVAADQTTLQGGSDFLAGLVNDWEEVPLFLRFSLEEITGLPRFSMSDLFWLGSEPTRRHALLVDASLVAINRRSRKPPSERVSACPQRLYLLLKRNGGYLCGHCTLDHGVLALHGYPTGSAEAQKFRDGSDAEVVGGISAILRRFR
ncbi:MAG: hypothetical protein WBQ34_07300 [Candidatus Acidiferrales bacterium]